MKKYICALLALACLFTMLAAAASADGNWTCPSCGRKLSSDYNFCPYDGAGKTVGNGSWPVISYEGKAVKFRRLSDSSARQMAYYGPDKNKYCSASGFKPAQVTSAMALFREGDYVLVDFSYTTAGKRCVYFKSSNLADDSGIGSRTMKGYSAETTMTLCPKLGPGTGYESLTQKGASKYASMTMDELVSRFGGSYEIWEALQPTKNSVYIEKGTNLSVFFEANGWVFAEFRCGIGLVRAWLPAASVEAQ